MLVKKNVFLVVAAMFFSLGQARGEGYSFENRPLIDFGNGQMVHQVISDFRELKIPVSYEGGPQQLGCQDFYWVQWIPVNRVASDFLPQDVECESDPGIPGQTYDNLRCGGTNLSGFFNPGRNVTREIRRGVYRDQKHFCFQDVNHRVDYALPWSQLSAAKKSESFVLIFFLPELVNVPGRQSTVKYIVGYRKI